MAKPPGRCIFCGKGDLTKQHLFPQWLQQIAAAAGPNHAIEFSGEVMHPDGILRTHKSETVRQGPTHTAKLRVVCRRCNNEWMSRLEERVKPLVTALVTGSPTTITRTQRKNLAAWITMVAAVSEYYSPKAVILPQVFRTRFMNTQAPSRALSVWIGNYSGKQMHMSLRKRQLSVQRKLGPEARHSLSKVYDERVAGPNLVTATFAIGHFYAHFFSSLLPEWVPLYRRTLKGGPIELLWPIQSRWLSSSLKWPFAQSVDDGMADTIGHWLNDFARSNVESIHMPITTFRVS